MRRIIFVLCATLSTSWQGFSQEIEGLSASSIKMVKEIQYHGNLDQFIMSEEAFKIYTDYKGNQFSQELYETYKTNANEYFKSICDTHMAENFEIKEFSTSNVEITGNSKDNIYIASIKVNYSFNAQDKTTELADLTWIKGKWYAGIGKSMGLAMIGLSQDKICMCVNMERRMERELDLAGENENQVKQIEENYKEIEKECKELGDVFKEYFKELTDEEKEDIISSFEDCVEEEPEFHENK